VLDKIRGNKSGWVEQAGRELGLIKTKAVEPPKNREATKLEVERARLVKKLAQAIKQQDAGATESIKKELTEITQQITDAKAKPTEATADEKSADQPMPDDKLAAVIKSTYLRTLSRMPSDDELARSVAYVQTSSDKLQGLGDVVWALINTKEFIVNH